MSAAQDEFNELMRDKERRTQHPADDDDDARSFLNLSEDDDATPPASHADLDEVESRPSLSQARSTIPTTRYGANTGPKGVISDAQHWRDSRRQHRTSMRSTASLASHMQSGLSMREQPPAEKVPEFDDEDEDDELDDDFMDKWRRNRLLEMRKGTPGSNMHSRERSRRLWGGLTTVDGEGYLDAVDKSPPDTVVVVYIYDDCSEVSTSVEECIRSIARKHIGTRFIKLHYRDAEMEPAGVPALLAYRSGDKFAGLVPVIQDIPDDADLSATTLENVLRRFVLAVGY
ncbi:hypothetical protein LTR85_009443 [Meristemomyces frigidus]|nr:hypothetical protein LTR85_009443 [Meristemomyces frigidus]